MLKLDISDSFNERLEMIGACAVIQSRVSQTPIRPGHVSFSLVQLVF